jgi:protocatechuate 3,4-dioxygenase beta subunit
MDVEKRRTPLPGIVLLLAAAVMAEAAEPVVGLPCEGCEAVFEGMPAKIESPARIAPRGEKGEPMHVSGRVVGPDGKPRSDVIVYAYHTDAAGIYPRPSKSLGRAADRHGRLRGWAVSDGDGRYSFESIRPASYPGQSIPAHIHMHVIERGCATYYIDEIVFTDDALLTPGVLSRHRANRGGSGITSPTRDAAGAAWRVARDIQLGLNIPGYPGCSSKPPS